MSNGEKCESASVEALLTRGEVEAIINDFEEHARNYHHTTSHRTIGALKKLEGWLQGRPQDVAHQRAQFLESYRYVQERDHARNEVEQLKREVASLRARLAPDPEPEPEPGLATVIARLLTDLLESHEQDLQKTIVSHTGYRQLFEAYQALDEEGLLP